MRFGVVDAFTRGWQPFTGNPAAVVPLLDGPGPAAAAAGPGRDAAMQTLAKEFNLSETAFVEPHAGGGDGQHFNLRWFTPACEVDLCGHATLAAASHLFAEGLADAAQPIVFHTRSGELTCSTAAEEGAASAKGDGGPPLIVMRFPAQPPAPLAADELRRVATALRAALGTPELLYVGRTGQNDLLVELPAAATVVGLAPDFKALKVSTGGRLRREEEEDWRGGGLTEHRRWGGGGPGHGTQRGWGGRRRQRRRRKERRRPRHCFSVLLPQRRHRRGPRHRERTLLAGAVLGRETGEGGAAGVPGVRAWRRPRPGAGGALRHPPRPARPADHRGSPVRGVTWPRAPAPPTPGPRPPPHRAAWKARTATQATTTQSPCRA